MKQRKENVINEKKKKIKNQRKTRVVSASGTKLRENKQIF